MIAKADTRCATCRCVSNDVGGRGLGPNSPCWQVEVDSGDTTLSLKLGTRWIECCETSS